MTEEIIVEIGPPRNRRKQIENEKGRSVVNLGGFGENKQRRFLRCGGGPGPLFFESWPPSETLTR